MQTTARKLPPPPRKANYQDVLDAPPNMVAQIIDGVFDLMPRPSWEHVMASGNLHTEINGRFGRYGDGPGGWMILHETELHLGEDVLVPDIAGWRLENFYPRPGVPWLDCTPDWVCEVLSPSTRTHDLGPKSDIYAREGVTHLWYVDPEARTLQAFVRTGVNWQVIVTLSRAATISIPPFETLKISLSHLWTGEPILPPSSSGGLAE